jgi:hypothetical protein
MRIRIQIQGFDDQKLGKITADKNFLIKKLPFSASIKDIQATGEVFIPQKRTSGTSKLKFSSLLWVIFGPLGFGCVFPMRIRIQPTKMNKDPDP